MKSKSYLTEKSQQLRRNMTKEERRLWYDFLKGLPITFNRQKAIGQYIVDFYCASAGVVVEIDGSQHYENIGKENDRVRDEYMKSLGLTVLRYSNDEVKSTNFMSAGGLTPPSRLRRATPLKWRRYAFQKTLYIHKTLLFGRVFSFCPFPCQKPVQKVSKRCQSFGKKWRGKCRNTIYRAIFVYKEKC